MTDCPDIYTALATPQPWQSSGSSFWQDEWISAQLLKNHLDSNTPGASRTLPFIDESVAWISTVAPSERHPRLIDYGCGPGLYTERLARCGYQVRGIDFSQRSIDYAKQSAKAQGLSIDYIHASYLDYQFKQPCDVATLIYCDYGALSPADRSQLLYLIRETLSDDGVLILDVFTPAKKDRDFTTGQTWQRIDGGGFWDPSAHVVLQRNDDYGSGLTLEQSTVVVGNDIRRFNIWNQYFTQSTLERELESAGFTVTRWYGNVVGAPYSETGEAIAALIRKDTAV